MNRDRKTRTSSDAARALAALKVRATLKLWLVTIMVTEWLAAIFSYVVDRLDAGASSLPTLMFTCVTSALVSRWLMADAARAWAHARERGYVRRRASDGHATTAIEVAPDCPKRWLVALHAGLNPAVAIDA
ncbi:MAG TPA: hypothetical protein VGM85_12865 [Paraburkholderia sp.]|jgi:hypothetical protein